MSQITEWLSGAIALMIVAGCLAVWVLRARLGNPRLGRTPQRVGSYLLLEKIAAGAMGEVYRARHLGTGHVLALKLLAPGAGNRERAQFEREARLGARLDHPNAAAVLDHGQAADGTRYLAMEFFPGDTLEDLIEREGPQPPARVITILLQVAAALAALHDQGVVHRDIKPSNILIRRDESGDQIKLIDFGLAKQLGELDPQPLGEPDPVVGTPLYISPEAITAPGTIDGRSDLYGLGAVAHYLLSGAPVFGGHSVVEVCGHHLHTPPEPLSRRVGWIIASDLEKVVLDCLAKDPAERPATARELASRLTRCTDADNGHAEDFTRIQAWAGTWRLAPPRVASVNRTSSTWSPEGNGDRFSGLHPSGRLGAC
jgi:serine/threonine-protein kinase